VSHRRRLLLVGSSLEAGGAERVLSVLANAWADRSEVSLATLASPDSDFYQLSGSVRRMGFGLTGNSEGLRQALRMNWVRIRRLEAAIREARAEVVISFLMQVNVVAILAARRAGVPVIVSERSDPTQHIEPRVWRIMRRVAYPFANVVVAQTASVASWLGRVVPRGRVVVIPNPVGIETQRTFAQGVSQVARPYMVAMGRLTREKGFDLLLSAYAATASSRRFDLVIIGEGPDRRALEGQVRELGLEGRVSLVGRISDPSALLSGASVFVLSSLYEGFPNALLEGMALGLPAVAFDCPSGVREIVRHGVDGLLVAPNQISAMAAAIDQILADDEARTRLASAAKEVNQRFSLPRIIEAWEAVIQRVSGLE